MNDLTERPDDEPLEILRARTYPNGLGQHPEAGTPAPAEPPVGVFFNPTPECIDFLLTLRPVADHKRVFMDIGAGSGYLAARINEQIERNGDGVLALDIMPHEETVYPVLALDALRFKFIAAMVPVIARPCHGSFAEGAIRNAVEGSGFCVYIGLNKNVTVDLGWTFDKPNEFTVRQVERFLNCAGAGGESVLLIGDPNRAEFREIFAQADPERQKAATTAPVAIPAAPAPDPEPEDEDTRIVGPVPPCARLGFISPGGEFYPCSYQHHKALACRLANRFIDKGKVYYGHDAMDALENIGWLRVMGEGRIDSLSDGRWTEPQISTVRGLIDAFARAEQEQPRMLPFMLKRDDEGYGEVSMWSQTPAWITAAEAEEANKKGDTEDADEWEEETTSFFTVEGSLARMQSALDYATGDAEIGTLTPPDRLNAGVVNRFGTRRADGTPDGD